MNDDLTPWMEHRDELFERVVRNGRARKHRRRAFAVAAAALTVLVAVAAGLYLPSSPTRSVHVANPGRQHETTTLPAPPPGTLLVGDAIMLGAESALERAIPGARVDARVSRQFFQAIPTLESDKQLGELPQTIVVHLGTNGEIRAAAIDQLMEVGGPQREVYFLNVNVPRAWQQEVNAALSSGAARWPNAHVLDWRGYSRSHSQWFTTDGFHLTPLGQTAYAEFIRDGLRTPAAERGDTRTP